MDELQKWKVFLSSTSKDLQAIREQVADHLKELGFEVVRFEGNFKIDPEASSHEVCLANVQNADMVVLLLDCRFGSKFKFNPNISITQAEYRKARKVGIPVFQFINKNLAKEYFSLLERAKKMAGQDAAPEIILKNLKEFKPEYADEIGLILFVGEIFSARKGDFAIFYEDWVDLGTKLNRRMQDYTPALLRRLVREQKKLFKQGDESRQFWLSLEELLKLKLYQRPRWHRVSYTTDNGDLAVLIVKWVKEGKHVLIRGKAGAGKTTELSRAFLINAKSIKAPSYSLPIFVRLRDLSFRESNILTVKELVDLQTKQLLKKEPFPTLRLEDIQLRLYLDGLDEIAVDPKDDEIRSLFFTPAMQQALVMTSRSDVANRICGNTPTSWSFIPVVEIEDWSPEMATEFIRRFCVSNQKNDLAQQILTPDVQKRFISLLTNPLMSTMLVFLIYEGGMQWPTGTEDRVALFTEFLNKWIIREVNRMKVPLSKANKIAEEIRYAWQLAAWEIYQYRHLGEKLTIEQLKNLIKEQRPETSDILESTGFRSLLVIRPVTSYVIGFAHEQFMEYLIAELFNQFCLNDDRRVVNYLNHAITFEVNSFIKGIWSRSSTEDLRKIIRNLEKIFNSTSDDHSGLQCKANIVYYWSRMTSYQVRDDVLQRLRHASNYKGNPYLRNGALFSLVRLGDKEAEARLYHSLTTDSLANSYNRRLHLEYFGDLEPQGGPPYEDDFSYHWNRAYEKLLEHIENNDEERFIFSRRIDIYTVRSFIESRKRRGPLDEQGLDRIKTALDQAIIKWSKHKDILEEATKEFYTLEERWKSFPQ